jgi:hypothetical protein
MSGEVADSVNVHAQGRRNPDITGRRMDAETDILDVLPDHLHGDLAQRDFGDHQYFSRFTVNISLISNVKTISGWMLKKPERSGGGRSVWHAAYEAAWRTPSTRALLRGSEIYLL